MNLETLKELSQGAVIKEVTGTITKLFAPKTGTNDNGPWSLQGGTLKFPNGELVDITFSGFEDMKNLRNKLVTITSGGNGKTPHGVQRDEYKDKVQLKITPAATVAEVSGGQPAASPSAPPPAQPAAPPAQSQRTPTAPAVTKPAPPAKSSPEHAVREAAVFVAKNLTLCRIAVKGAMKFKVEFENYYKEKMSDALLVSAFNALLFGSSANGVIHNLPTDLDFETLKPVTKGKQPTQPADPDKLKDLPDQKF